MTDDRRPLQPPGPMLVCAGTDPAATARLAEVAACLLGNRPAVVLATWEPPPLAGVESLKDARYDLHEELRDAARHAAMQAAHAASDALEAHGVHVTRQVCPEEQSPWQEILDAANRLDASVIVAGVTEQPSARPGTLGGQARALAHRARRPLLLVPAGAGTADDAAPALLAHDGSASSKHAVGEAAQLLRRRPAIVATVWLTARYVVGAAMIAVPEEVVRKGAAELDEAARVRAVADASQAAGVMTSAGWSCSATAIETTRNVPAAIVDAADEHDAAVIVTGTRGRSRIVAALLGSNAESILRTAGRPVLLVPPVGE